MTTNPATTEEQEAWGLETRLVHGGSLRSQFAELSEAVYLTQSYVYASAEQAEERFKSEAGFIYSRYANPTVAMRIQVAFCGTSIPSSFSIASTNASSLSWNAR